MTAFTFQLLILAVVLIHSAQSSNQEETRNKRQAEPLITNGKLPVGTVNVPENAIISDPVQIAQGQPKAISGTVNIPGIGTISGTGRLTNNGVVARVRLPPNLQQSLSGVRPNTISGSGAVPGIGNIGGFARITSNGIIGRLGRVGNNRRRRRRGRNGLRRRRLNNALPVIG